MVLDLLRDINSDVSQNKCFDWSGAMRKLDLNQWAAISEIVASVGVILSILFLAYSINVNTVITQSANDNFLYELQFARVREITGNINLATIYTKLGQDIELSDVEQTQLRWDNLQQLGTWELAFVRHRDGVYADDRWEAWDQYFRLALLDTFPKQDWEEVRNWYEDDFLFVAEDKLSYIKEYLNEDDRAYLNSHEVALKKIKYDWGLNEIKTYGAK